MIAPISKVDTGDADVAATELNLRSARLVIEGVASDGAPVRLEAADLGCTADDGIVVIRGRARAPGAVLVG